MRRIFTKKMTIGFIRYALGVVILMNFSLNVSGQILWGAGSSNLASDETGRFANDFGTANAWTAVAITPGALWTRTTTGVSQGPYWGNNVAFQSPTLSDGAALFDSDYYDQSGLATPHKGELISPTIDLTGLSEGDLIEANVFLYYRSFDVSEFSLGFSSDGGATWKNFPLNVLGNEVNGVYGQKYITIRMLGATAGVVNFSNCKLRLVFEGDGYFAMVDNISINKTALYDITFPKPGTFDNQSTMSPAA